MSYDFFPDIHSLLTILATLPVTTATAEQSFSTLWRLKIYLRNKMGEIRLTGLALLNKFRNFDFNVKEIIDRFAKLQRKWNFILKFVIKNGKMYDVYVYIHIIWDFHEISVSI